MEYEAVDVKLEIGDLAVLYTDGINEAMNSADEEFGIDKLRELTAIPGDADEVKDRIVKAVLEHVGDAPPFDDMCLVVMERVPRTPASPVTDTVDEDVIDSVLQEPDFG